jgi:hypothetical protein
MSQMKYEPKGNVYLLNNKIIGKILWDEENDTVAIQIDDKELTLEEFGRALSVFEGWTFKLEFLDPSL